MIDVKDDRFAAIHEDHQFAIDPSNPQCVPPLHSCLRNLISAEYLLILTFANPFCHSFKKTKGMAALLDERTKRKKSRNDRPESLDSQTRGPAKEGGHDRSLQSLVESVKRKSAAADQGGIGKRRKL